jgi:hypothetical protein
MPDMNKLAELYRQIAELSNDSTACQHGFRTAARTSGNRIGTEKKKKFALTFYTNPGRAAVTTIKPNRWQTYEIARDEMLKQVEDLVFSGSESSSASPTQTVLDAQKASQTIRCSSKLRPTASKWASSSTLEKERKSASEENDYSPTKRREEESSPSSHADHLRKSFKLLKSSRIDWKPTLWDQKPVPRLLQL